MIILESLKAVDFLSFMNVEYNMVLSPINIQGDNKTDDDKESNGSGKSGLMAIIEFATRGTNSRKEKDKNLIRRGGSTKAEVSVVYFCPTRKERLEITREIKLKGSSKLALTINGEPQEFSTVKDGNAFIFNWLDTTPEDFASYHLINRERFKSFFSSSNTERLALISRLQGTGDLSYSENKVKEDIQEKSDVVKSVEREVAHIEGEIMSLEKRLDALNNISVSETTEEKVNKILDSVELNWGVVAENEASVLEQRGKLLEVDAEIEQMEAEIEAFKSKIPDSEQLRADLNELQDGLNYANRELSLSLNKVNGSIDCPKCEHSFVVGQDVDLEAEKAIIEELKSMIEVMTTDIVSLEGELSDINKLRAELDAKNKMLSRKNLDVNRISSQITRTESAIEKLKSDNELLINQAEAIKQKESPDNTKEIATISVDLEDANKRLIDKLKELGQAEQERDEVTEWVTNFKRFKIFLANKVTNRMQTLCNEQLSKMSSNLRVQIEGFKVLDKGKIKEEITPLVVEDEAASFFSYSGGERAKVEFAMILAIQEMINANNKWGGINLLCMDEVLEGIDPLGLNLLMKSIRNLGMAVMIITHVTDRKVKEGVLVIEKVNGISRIKEN